MSMSLSIISVVHLRLYLTSYSLIFYLVRILQKKDQLNHVTKWKQTVV